MGGKFILFLAWSEIENEAIPKPIIDNIYTLKNEYNDFPNY